MKPEPIEEVVELDWSDGKWTCGRCGDTFHLWFNGGELDRHVCSCGREWFQESVGYNLKMRQPK